MESVLLTNIPWMSWNAFLALMGLYFGVLFYRVRQSWLKGLMGVAWLMLVPNTLYLLTDIKHILYQWYMVDSVARIILMSQYVVLLSLGVATYVQSMRWFEHGLFVDPQFSKKYILAGLRRRLPLVMTGINFLIAFGIVMGRVLRTNSWYVVTQPLRVLEDAWRVVTTLDLMLLVVAFFAVVQGVYLLGRLVHSNDWS